MAQQLDSAWSEEQVHTLGQFGIFMINIKEAYRYLAGQSTIMLKRFSLDSEEEDATIMQIVEACQIRKRAIASFDHGHRSDDPLQLAIAVNTTDPEALCIGNLLREMLQVQVQVKVGVVLSAIDSATHRDSVDYLIVVLTKGAPSDVGFGEVVLSFTNIPERDEQVEMIPILADTNFDFSSMATLDPNLKARDLLISAYQSVLKVLAVGFSPHGSAALLDTQVQAITKRLKKYNEKCDGLSKTTPTPTKSRTKSRSLEDGSDHEGLGDTHSRFNARASQNKKMENQEDTNQDNNECKGEVTMGQQAGQEGNQENPVAEVSKKYELEIAMLTQQLHEAQGQLHESQGCCEQLMAQQHELQNQLRAERQIEASLKQADSTQKSACCKGVPL
eukprot:gnl/MRDRNA2_/MRDRNA2_18359_c0_seq1.p1 gnl/MRDRNA2_/MRDRNA2_18359_c0~~gnl/MRDRNA2_/MRDRNA2_18359_c0_seq1.p1  ORF type:complete len:439 (+),score=89.27 gnl/MRDRNA2_/MRDRNA2_18359_c0_seq1:153-1319(+)